MGLKSVQPMVKKRFPNCPRQLFKKTAHATAPPAQGTRRQHRGKRSTCHRRRHHLRSLLLALSRTQHNDSAAGKTEKDTAIYELSFLLFPQLTPQVESLGREKR